MRPRGPPGPFWGELGPPPVESWGGPGEPRIPKSEAASEPASEAEAAEQQQ